MFKSQTETSKPKKLFAFTILDLQARRTTKIVERYKNCKKPYEQIFPSYMRKHFIEAVL